jgi:hypothetical protein
VASRSQGIGAQNRLANSLSGWAFSSRTTFGPDCFSRAGASAVVRPPRPLPAGGSVAVPEASLVVVFNISLPGVNHPLSPCFNLVQRLRIAYTFRGTKKAAEDNRLASECIGNSKTPH